MKKFIDEDAGIMLAKDAKPGFVYGVLGEGDLAIIHDLGDGRYGLSSLVVGKNIEDYDEMVWKSLDGMISALLDLEYEVFSFSSINEFAEWADRITWPELEPEREGPLSRRQMPKFSRIESPKTIHAIDRIVYGNTLMTVDTLCGLRQVFDRDKPQLNTHGWSLRTRESSIHLKHNCGNCENRPRFSSWRWDDLEALVKVTK